MTLYEFVNATQRDYDAFDDVYDACVTVCYIGKEESDDYDRFCNGIMKKVNVTERKDNCTLIVDWSELVKRNMDKFRAFTRKNWFGICQYEDDVNEFIYQWIKEIHLYMAGYVSDGLYKKLVDFVEELV